MKKITTDYGYRSAYLEKLRFAWAIAENALCSIMAIISEIIHDLDSQEEKVRNEELLEDNVLLKGRLQATFRKICSNKYGSGKINPAEFCRQGKINRNAVYTFSNHCKSDVEWFPMLETIIDFSRAADCSVTNFLSILFGNRNYRFSSFTELDNLDRKDFFLFLDKMRAYYTNLYDKQTGAESLSSYKYTQIHRKETLCPLYNNRSHHSEVKQKTNLEVFMKSAMMLDESPLDLWLKARYLKEKGKIPINNEEFYAYKDSVLKSAGILESDT